MVERKRRKKNRVRGERTHSKGGTKNNRGAGTRGGRGRAGSNKHKFHSLGRLDDRKYRLKPKAKGQVISLGELNERLDELLAKGKVSEEKGMIVVGPKSGYEKVLSQGNIDKKVLLKINAVRGAIKKIEDAGGKFDFEKKGQSKEDVFDEEFEAAESEGVEE